VLLPACCPHPMWQPLVAGVRHVKPPGQSTGMVIPPHCPMPSQPFVNMSPVQLSAEFVDGQGVFTAGYMQSPLLMQSVAPHTPCVNGQVAVQQCPVPFAPHKPLTHWSFEAQLLPGGFVG
jgi:hypothetical protein